MDQLTENELIDLIGVPGVSGGARSQQAQAELLRRQIVELRKSNEITEKNNAISERYNLAMVNLTMVLFFVAILQIIVPIWLAGLSQWTKAKISIGIMVIVAFAFWYVFKEMKEKN